MRVFICLCACAVILSGCGVPMERHSAAYEVRQSFELVWRTQRDIKTASCEQIDHAMSYTYIYYKSLSDKRVVQASANGKPKYAKLMGTLFKVYLTNFKDEYARRCKGEPIRTKMIEKLYPTIARIAQEIYDENRRKMQKH